VQSGETVGTFRVDRLLGRGGMGEVWKAWDPQLNRWVALKFLRGDSEDEIARFEREAQTAGQLTHPNIAAVYEVGCDEGRHYIAMQFVEGRTLKSVPRHDRRALARHVRDAARAVAFAHERGVVHRDLKPDNLMVARDHVYVMDFGLARAVKGDSRLSVSGMVVGTPSYMPPEQARGERVDARADVYALGATLYELLTDRVVFDGSNIYDVLIRVAEEDPKPPRAVDPAIDRDLNTIVLKCLEKDRDRRYAGANALADDLDRWLEGEPITARPSTVVYRLLKRFRKRPVTWSLAAVATAALVAAAILLSRASSDLSQAEWANQISGAYYEMSLKTMHEMELLEDHHNGARVSEEDVRSALEAVEAQAKSCGSQFPAVRLPQAWRALANYYARRPGAREELETAVRDAREDPFPAVLLVRMHLAEYRQSSGFAAVEWTGRLRIRDVVENNAMRRHRASAGEAVARALPMKVWSRLRHGREYIVYAEGASLLASGRYEEAAARLGELAGEPLLRDEAAALRGSALLCASRFREAAAAYEVATRRGWTAAIYAMGYALGALGMSEADAGRDPVPHYDRALESLRRLRGSAVTEATIGMLHLARGDAVGTAAGDPRADFRAAVEALTAALEKDASLVQARANRATARAAVGESVFGTAEDPGPWYDGAIEDATEVMRLAPSLTQPYTARALALRGRAVIAITRGEDPVPAAEQAVADATEAIRRLPELPMAWSYRGMARLVLASTASLRGDARAAFDEALADFDESVRRQPRQAVWLSNRGHGRARRADAEGRAGRDPIPGYEQAIEDLDAALVLQPRDAVSKRDRASVRYEMALASAMRGLDPTPHLEAAEREFDALAREHPDFLDGFTAGAAVQVIRGHVEAGRGGDAIARYDRAIAAYGEVVRRRPRDPGALAGRGTAYMARAIVERRRGLDTRRTHEQALADFEASLAERPRQPDTLGFAGRALQNLGRRAEAVAKYEASLRLAPSAQVEAWLREARGE
jgi:serine/threonine-protein kinase